MRYFLLILFFVFLLTSCQKAESQHAAASPDAKRYPLRGKVIAVDKTKKKATIAHEEVPGYMDAMTMDFPVRNEDALNTMTKDSVVSAELVVDNAKGAYWLENLAVTMPSADPSAPPLKEGVVQVGRETPDFRLTNQDGRQISLKEFRGRALAITFIYSRCPLPNYCILMSKNFSDLALKIQSDRILKDRIRLLSISFDPATDTPETLRKYGLGYLGANAKPDFTVWQLATAAGGEPQVKEIADFFGLLYETDAQDKTQFNHSLRTVVIAPDGRVRKVFAGSDWTTDELLQEMQATLR